jgi:predicted porin
LPCKKTTGSKFAAAANGLANNGNSRFGFKGTEDLGGGLKVSFNMEAAVNLATGDINSTNMFQRAAYLAVSGGFGELSAGRRLTPSFLGMANYELTGTANYSAVANTFGYGGSLSAVRNSAQVAYTTPNMGGFKAMLGTILAGNNGGNAKTDLNATYNAGPLALGVTYDKISGSEAGKSIGGAYDLGQFILAASYQDPYGALKGYTIGGTAKLGANTVTLDIAHNSGSGSTPYPATGTVIVAKPFTNYVLEAKEPLSKRTFLYQIYFRDGFSAKSTVAAGLRHNF